MTLPVFVVDTNVVAAGIITATPGSPPAAIVDAMLAGALIYLLSPALLAEYRAVLLRPRISARHGLSEGAVDALLVELTANAMWREPAVAPPAPDRGDDHLWALLATRPGSMLVTGDRLLLAEPPAGNRVMAPATWLAEFTHGCDGKR